MFRSLRGGTGVFDDADRVRADVGREQRAAVAAGEHHVREVLPGLEQAVDRAGGGIVPPDGAIGFGGEQDLAADEGEAMRRRQTLIRVGPGPEGLDLSPDGRELWTAHSGDRRVSVIDVATKKVTQTFDAGTRRANRLKFTPDGRLVLISDMDSGELVVVDARTRGVPKRLPVGRMPAGILVRPDGRIAYVAVTGDNRVAAIDLQKLDVVQTIAAGGGPDGMAWIER